VSTFIVRTAWQNLCIICRSHRIYYPASSNFWRPTERLPSMNKSNHSSRREFLQVGAAAAAVFTIVPRHVLGGRGFVAPSDKVNVTLIGAGGQGRTNARALFRLNDAQII